MADSRNVRFRCRRGLIHDGNSFPYTAVCHGVFANITVLPIHEDALITCLWCAVGRDSGATEVRS